MPTEAELAEMRKLRQPGGAAATRASRGRIGRTVSAGSEHFGQSGEGAEELQDFSTAESIERKARLAGSGGVQAAGDILSLPVSAADIAVEADPFGGHESNMGQAVRDLFGIGADAIRGGVTPQDGGERIAQIGGEETLSAIPIAWGLRKLSMAKVAAGNAGRMATALAKEKIGHFIYGEGLGLGGATLGRYAFEDVGPIAAGVGGVIGDLSVRNIPFAAVAATRKLGRFLSIKFESVARQEIRLQTEIRDLLASKGGIEKMASTEKGRRILNLAAERVQRATGNRQDGEAALKIVDEIEAYAKELGIPLEDFAIPSLLDNPGLKSVVQRAEARNPNLAVHFQAASERGLAAVRRVMARLGPPIENNSSIDSVRAAVRSESERRMAAVTREVDRLEDLKRAGAQGQDDAAIGAVGGYGRKGAAQAEKEASSTAFGEALIASWLKAKEDLVDPKYDYVESLAEQFGDILFGVSHTKKALDKIRRPLREAGKLKAKNEYFDLIDNWSADGVSFDRLRDMDTTLAEEIYELKKAGSSLQADRLQKLKNGIQEDILSYELKQVETLPAAARLPDEADPALAARGNTVDLARQRTNEGRAARGMPDPGDPKEPFSQPSMLDTKRARAGREPIPEQPMKPVEGEPGRVVPVQGRGDAGDTLDLDQERSREIITKALDEANEAYMTLAREYYDPIATGKILDAHRTKNPVAFADQLALYFDPGTAKNSRGYAKRVEELRVRASDSPETLKNAEDWLVADAYQHSVMDVAQPDGSTRPRLDRKKLDAWKERNSHALNAFPGAKNAVDDASTMVDRARELGAVPIVNPGKAATQALDRFVHDPQEFWGTIAKRGTEEGLDQVRDIIRTVKASGDGVAFQGLRDSFWSSHLVRRFTVEGTGSVTPKQMHGAIREILDSPALRETVEALFGPEHVRLLELSGDAPSGSVLDALRSADRATGAAIATGKIPGDVQPQKLATAGAQAQKVASEGGLYNAILGPVKKSVKGASALEKFKRNVTDLQVTAIEGELGRNPALLRDLLVRNPSGKLVKSIWTRMGKNLPTIFPRSQFAQEREDERVDKEAASAKTKRLRKERAAREAEPANRGVTAPPRTSLMRAPERRRSIIG